MPIIDSQKKYRDWPKPEFCYLCGQILADESALDDDHCPPLGLFRPEHRGNYPIILRVHRRCNHAWHAADERLTTTYAMLHGTLDPQDQRRRWPKFHDVTNDQGTFLGATELPFRELTFRIVRCAHALLYGDWLPDKTPNSIHIPVPEVDIASGNRPKRPLPQVRHFAKHLCTAQKAKTFDGIVAYAGRFKYVTTWVHADGGEPFCILTLDIYELHRLGMVIDGFPRAIIGSYQWPTPKGAARLTSLEAISTEAELLYPILI